MPEFQQLNGSEWWTFDSWIEHNMSSYDLEN